MTEQSLHRLIGATAYDRDGLEVGTISQVHLDEATGRPLFLAIGAAHVGVPATNVVLEADGIRLPYPWSQVDSAPSVIVVDGLLDPDEERRLYDHYDMTPDGRPSVIRSEERLRPVTRVVASTRLRMRKYVVTEMETITIPVRRERVVLESVPDGEYDDLTPGESPQLRSPGTVIHEMILHEERAVVTTVVVPVERVTLSIELEAGTQTVVGDVRHEHVELGVVRGDARGR